MTAQRSQAGWSKVAALGVASLLVGVGCAGARAETRPDGLSGDDAIAADVRRVLAEDRRVDASEIRVEVRDGVVILQGVVATLDEARRALRLAGRVRGVGQVVNRLRVLPRSTRTAKAAPPRPARRLRAHASPA